MISISVAVTIGRPRPTQTSESADRLGQVVGKKVSVSSDRADSTQVFISDAMVLATHLLRCQNDISEEDEDVEPTDLMAGWSRFRIS